MAELPPAANLDSGEVETINGGGMRVIRILFGALPLVGLAAGIACAPLVRPQHPNAVAIQIVNAAGGPRCEGPEGVEFNPATVCAPQFDLEQAPGIAASYSRRVWALTEKDGINLRIGPECPRTHRDDRGHQEHHDAAERDVSDVGPGEDVTALVHGNERPQGT